MYEAFSESIENHPELRLLIAQIDAEPQSPRWHFELGSAAGELGYWQLAEECYTSVTEIAPRIDAGFFNLGNALFELKKFEQARNAYEQALELNPECGTIINLGTVFASMENWARAIELFAQVLKMPTCTAADARRALGNRGKALFATADWDEAIENYRQANKMFPDDERMLVNQAHCHRQLHQYSHAITCLVRAIEIRPNHPEILGQIAELNFTRGRITESMLCLDRAFEIERPSLVVQSMWLKILTHYPRVTPERLFDEAMRWGRSVSESLSKHDPTSPPESLSERETLFVAQANDQTRPAIRPVRVGILSNSKTSLEMYPEGVAPWLSSLIAHSDSSKLAWTVYLEESMRHNSLPENLSNASLIKCTNHLSDEALASLIHDDTLDILIDTIGHGRNNRLQVFARRSAPIQIAWGGFLGTSGLAEMDFILADSQLLPPDLEPFFSEQVYRLPSCAFCFKPPALRGETSTFKDLGESQTYRCGCLCRPETLNEDLIETWSGVLSNIVDSELIFIGPAYADATVQNDMRDWLERFGIDRARIQFQTASSVDALHDALGLLDVTLDSFPVNSMQAAFHALSMGVPVVSKVERRIAGRSVSSVLHALSRNDWIAQDRDGYVSNVIRLASRRVEVRQQRAQLRTDLLASPICDIPRFANQFQVAMVDLVSKVHSRNNEGAA
jgi:protein O-GlcNAc transferase